MIKVKCGYPGCENEVPARSKRDVVYCSRTCATHASRLGRYRGGRANMEMVREVATRPVTKQQQSEE